MSKIVVLSGLYRNKPVVNQEFVLIKGFTTGKKGNYVTVKNEGHFDIDISEVKIKVDSIDQIRFTGGAVVTSQPEEIQFAAPIETEEEAMDRIATRFSILDEMSKACINGDIRAMIVTGPPGVGKSHGVTTQMEKASLFDKIGGKKLRFEIVKGTMSAIGLFALLYKFSDKQNVLVFDDCDIWSDPDALNILKAALDSGKTRRISYNKDSRLLRDEGVPNTFDFHGSIIFITNVDVANSKRNAIKPHLEALQSRSHYLDLTIATERDKMLRIKQVHRDADPGLFVDYNFTKEQEEVILNFMWDNHTKLREVSIRCALKLADLMKISPNNWKELAKATICK